MLKAHGTEAFNFDITEIQILENGNKFIGSKRVTITSNDGILIKADQFEYDKNLNRVTATLKILIYARSYPKFCASTSGVDSYLRNTCIKGYACHSY